MYPQFQLKSNECLLAAMATLLHVDQLDLLHELPPIPKGLDAWPIEFYFPLCLAKGYALLEFPSTAEYEDSEIVLKVDYDEIPYNGIYIIHGHGPDNYHAVVKCETTYFDPSIGFVGKVRDPINFIAFVPTKPKVVKGLWRVAI